MNVLYEYFCTKMLRNGRDETQRKGAGGEGKQNNELRNRMGKGGSTQGSPVVRLHMKKRPQARAACSLIIGSLSLYVS